MEVLASGKVPGFSMYLYVRLLTSDVDTRYCSIAAISCSGVGRKLGARRGTPRGGGDRGAAFDAAMGVDDGIGRGGACCLGIRGSGMDGCPGGGGGLGPQPPGMGPGMPLGGGLWPWGGVRECDGCCACDDPCARRAVPGLGIADGMRILLNLDLNQANASRGLRPRGCGP